MGKSDRAAKDKNHAAYMKKHSIKRTTFRCFCGKMVGVGSLLLHFGSGQCR